MTVDASGRQLKWILNPSENKVKNSANQKGRKMNTGRVNVASDADTPIANPSQIVLFVFSLIQIYAPSSDSITQNVARVSVIRLVSKNS